MNDTIKPPAGFDAIPVGGPAAVLDIPRPLPPQPRPAPRQTMPLPPLPEAEPPKSPPVSRHTPAQPVAILPPEPPPEPAPEPNPLAGSPPPKASVFSGIVWDLLRPNRAKVAVLAGVVSLAAGAFGLNLLIPSGTQTPPAQVKIKIPPEEPKSVAAAPKVEPVVEPKVPAMPPRVGELSREPVKSFDPFPPAAPGPKPADALDLPALPGFDRTKLPELPVPSKPTDVPQPIYDPKLVRTNGTGDTLPPAPAPLPLPGGAGGAPMIPSAPVMPGTASGEMPTMPAMPGAVVTPKPIEPHLPPASGGLPALPGAGAAPITPDMTKPTLPGLPGLPPVIEDKKPAAPTGLPTMPALPGGPLPSAVGTLPVPGGAEVKLQPGAALPGEVKPLPVPGGPEVKPQPGAGLPALPGGAGSLPLPSEVKPAEVKPLEVKPLEPLPPSTPPVKTGELVGAGAVAPVPLPGSFGAPPPAPALQQPMTDAKTDYDVDLHRARAGDTYATISKAYYGGAQYAAALQAFNRNQPIDRVGEVQVPPVHVIRKFAPSRAVSPQPERFQPVRGGGGDGPEWGAPGAVGNGQTTYNLFTVPRKGLTLRDVAKMYYGDERSWTKLNNPRNPKFDADQELPVGTQIQVPSDPVTFR